MVLEQKLRKWLSQPEADILRRVVAARCEFLQAEALKKALHAIKGEAADLLQQDDMKQAARFDTFNQILTELSDQPKETPFQLAKKADTITVHANITSTGPEEA